MVLSTSVRAEVLPMRAREETAMVARDVMRSEQQGAMGPAAKWAVRVDCLERAGSWEAAEPSEPVGALPRGEP